MRARLGALAFTLAALFGCAESKPSGRSAGAADTGADAGVMVVDGAREVSSEASLVEDGEAGAPADGGEDGDGAAALACSAFGPAGLRGRLDSPLLDEVSGVVASRQNARVLWMHNDSGDSARVFAVRDDAVLLGIYELENATSVDWEDIALGPGPVPGADYLYIGDIGDNDEVRASIVVYRVREPSVPADAGASSSLGGVEAFALRYPAGAADGGYIAHNAETLLIDPVSGQLFIVTKSSRGSLVYRSPPLSSNAPNTLELVATLHLPGDGLATGGDIAPSGAILIRTYSKALLWPRSPGASVGSALLAEPCPVPLETEGQGEAVAFAPDGNGYFTTSEGLSPPLYFFGRAE